MTRTQAKPPAPLQRPDDRRTSFRWAVLGLVFLATVINYVDRAVLGVLKPTLEQHFGWTQVDYGWIVTSFQFTYAVGYPLLGAWTDRIGLRWGYFLAVVLWSAAATAHAGARSISGFCIARAGLGFAEGGNFPAAVKTVAEWFPKQQRALATGLFNAGSNLGAVACPLVVPWLVLRSGWQSAFLATGALGFVWALLWMALYRAPQRHPWVSPAELAFIRSDPPDPAGHISWLRLLGYRQTWACVAGMLLSAPIWWFFIYWVPDFLNKQHHLNLTESSLPLVVIFVMSDLGGIAGGWFSSALIRRGWSINAARKTALLVCALCVLPVYGAGLVTGLWTAVLLVGVAASAHCAFTANLWAMLSDTVPRKAISSVIGIGGMAGALAGIGFTQAVARILQATHNNYLLPFAAASLSYVAAVGIIQALLPRLEPMELSG